MAEKYYKVCVVKDERCTVVLFCVFTTECINLRVFPFPVASDIWHPHGCGVDVWRLTRILDIDLSFGILYRGCDSIFLGSRVMTGSVRLIHTRFRLLEGSLYFTIRNWCISSHNPFAMLATASVAVFAVLMLQLFRRDCIAYLLERVSFKTIGSIASCQHVTADTISKPVRRLNFDLFALYLLHVIVQQNRQVSIQIYMNFMTNCSFLHLSQFKQNHCTSVRVTDLL